MQQHFGKICWKCLTLSTIFILPKYERKGCKRLMCKRSENAQSLMSLLTVFRHK
uniref:Uncharacterized protein n=1 Tax=Arundo donax TaxID=35708 RepID=A0A0A9CD85_ARUDO